MVTRWHQRLWRVVNWSLLLSYNLSEGGLSLVSTMVSAALACCSSVFAIEILI